MTVCAFLGLNTVIAQSRLITGTVTNARDGSSITGVTVIVKGTTIGSITNMDGLYTINIPETATTLVFSFVGMTGEFEYQSEDFENRYLSLDNDDLSAENFPEMLKKAGYGNTLLTIEITYGGMACGRVWYTDIIGFDYKTLSP